MESLHSTSPTISLLEFEPFSGAQVPYYWLISELTIRFNLFEQSCSN